MTGRDKRGSTADADSASHSPPESNAIFLYIIDHMQDLNYSPKYETRILLGQTSTEIASIICYSLPLKTIR